MMRARDGESSTDQQLKKMNLKLILTKVLDLILTKTDSKMLETHQLEIVDRKFRIIWPQVQELDIPLEILKDVESSLVNDLLTQFDDIECLKARFLMSSSENERELTQAIKDFLKQSTLQTYANRARHYLNNNWHKVVGVACVALPLTWLLTRKTYALEVELII